MAWIATGLFALAALVCVPIGMEADTLLKTQDDPAAIADRHLAKVFDQSVAADQIEAALAANDADLAKSYVELAQDRGITLPVRTSTTRVDRRGRAGEPRPRRRPKALPVA